MSHYISLILLDRTGERYFHINIPWWGVIVGYIIGLSTPSVGGRYVAMFLMASGYAGKSCFLYAQVTALLVADGNGTLTRVRTDPRLGIQCNSEAAFQTLCEHRYREWIWQHREFVRPRRCGV